jgi:hypothetical protein
MNGVRRSFSPHSPVDEEPYFINQKQIMETLLRYVHKPEQCCYLIGGAGMGKTSVLRRLRRIVLDGTLTPQPYRLIPVLFEVNRETTRSFPEFYRELLGIALTSMVEWLQKTNIAVPATIEKALEIEARLPEATELANGPEMQKDCKGRFLRMIRKIHSIAPNTKVLLLIDNLYLLPNRALMAEIGQHFFRYLDEGRDYGKYLKDFINIVISCDQDPYALFSLGTSGVSLELERNRFWNVPLSNLDPADVVREGIRNLFWEEHKRELPAEIADVVCLATGTHPFLLQKVMLDLSNNADPETDLTEDWVREQSEGWHTQIAEVYRYVERLIPTNPMIAPILEELADNGDCTVSDLAEVVPESARYMGQLKEALDILLMCGVVRKVGPRAYCLTGSLLRDRFRPLVGTLADGDDLKTSAKRLARLLNKTIQRLGSRSDDTARLLRGEVSDKLSALRADLYQLRSCEAHQSPGNPTREDIVRLLVRDIYSIQLYLKNDLRERLSAIGIEM